MKPLITFGSFKFDDASGYPVPQITTSLNRKRTSAQQYIGTTNTISLNGFVSGVGFSGLFQNALNLKNNIIVSNPQSFIFQIGSYGTPKRSVSYSASFPKPFSGVPTNLKNAVDSALFGFAPSGISPTNADARMGPKFFSWLTENSESLDVFGGKYTRKLTWEYQKGYIPP